MEDYNSNLLNDSKNEWSIRLMNILSGHIIDGFRSIFNEALEICTQNEEPEKYLMTFQNFLSRIPKWNQNMIETESQRIVANSQCNYLDDLITCVHIIQLKILSCVRTSNHNKKIEINIPNFVSFLHNVYINIARKLYSNIYLFQIDVTPLEQQKNNREFELIVQSCIMNTIRDNIPIDHLLRQYIDETQEVDIEKKETVVKKEEVVEASENKSVSINSVNPLQAAEGSNVEEKTNMNKLSQISDSETENVPEHISFSNSVDTKTFESDPSERINEYDSDAESLDEPIQIGESIDLQGLESLDSDENKVVSEDNPPPSLTTGFDLGIESLDEPEPLPSALPGSEPKTDIIDLGITELDM